MVNYCGLEAVLSSGEHWAQGSPLHPEVNFKEGKNAICRSATTQSLARHLKFSVCHSVLCYKLHRTRFTVLGQYALRNMGFFQRTMDKFWPLWERTWVNYAAMCCPCTLQFLGFEYYCLGIDSAFI